DEHGNQKAELKRGEHKSLQTDRVILIPGPPEEVETVRWMYKAFTREGMQESRIAAILNQRGVLTDLDRQWTRGTVHEVLTNEKYIGNNVFNRTSFKLKKRRVENTPDMWVRKDGVFEPIVEASDFYTAQGIVRERSRKYSNEEMLDKLRQLHEQHGWLSGFIINESENMPSSSVYTQRFGSLIRAYKLIGFTPDHDYRYIEINRQLRKMHSDIVEDTIRKIEALGGKVRQENPSELLIINDALRVSLVICRCHHTQGDDYRWKVRFDTGLMPDITVAVRMAAGNERPLDYYLLPALDIENPKMRLAENNGLALDSYQFDDLELFFQLTERVTIKEAA
ncbi:MAG: recombinase family protein, partial [Bdellovibrionales bacterium]